MKIFKSLKKSKNKSLKGSGSGEHKADPDEDEPYVLNKEPPLMEELLKPMTPLAQVTDPKDREALLVQKFRLCQVQFNWKEDGERTFGAQQNMARAKEIKRQILCELVEMIGKGHKDYTKAVLHEAMHMVLVNIDRGLPSPTDPNGEGAEEPYFCPEWPHLQIVYEFLLRFVVSGDVSIKTLRTYLTLPVIMRILALFYSEDSRERDYLKTVLHRIYAKMMSLRSMIRAAIVDILATLTNENKFHPGVGELLEVLGSIVSGFSVPLKAEHRRFLHNVLMPLHKVEFLEGCTNQLGYCIFQFIEKDPSLASSVVKSLLKWWPITSSSKEIIYLNVLEDILELTRPEDFVHLIPVLCRRLAASIFSQHFQVAERALFLWHNEKIGEMFLAEREKVLPILYPALNLKAEGHWNPGVNNLIINVLTQFTDHDPELVTQVSQACAEVQRSREAMNAKKRLAWLELEAKFPVAE